MNIKCFLDIWDSSIENSLLRYVTGCCKIFDHTVNCETALFTEKNTISSCGEAQPLARIQTCP